MDKKIEEKTKDINEKIQKLDLAIQELIETTDNFFINDKYYGIECAFILYHALNIKMHFFNKYPAFAPPHLRGVENYDRIIHIRENNPEDKLEQISPLKD